MAELDIRANEIKLQIPEILEAIKPELGSPETSNANESIEALETVATISTPQVAQTPVETNNTPEIFEANTVARQVEPIPITTTETPTPEQVSPVAPIPPTTTTLNKTKDNKPRPHTPFDLDAFIETIPPALVAPMTQPTILSTLTKYIDNIEFCYRFLYFVRNNKNNQTDELKTIAKIIMEYYAPNDTTYFNFELKKIDLTNKTNKNIDDITIYTNKGEQTLAEMLKDATQVAPQVAPVINTVKAETTKVEQTTEKGGRVKPRQKQQRTLKKRKSKSKGITIKMH
jgi:hypothetical protein